MIEMGDGIAVAYAYYRPKERLGELLATIFLERAQVLSKDLWAHCKRSIKQAEDSMKNLRRMESF